VLTQYSTKFSLQFWFNCFSNLWVDVSAALYFAAAGLCGSAASFTQRWRLVILTRQLACGLKFACWRGWLNIVSIVTIHIIIVMLDDQICGFGQQLLGTNS
jgi:hypothetical protein